MLECIIIQQWGLSAVGCRAGSVTPGTDGSRCLIAHYEQWKHDISSI